MNAAARAINQSNLFSGHLLRMQFSKTFYLLFSLLLLVLLSALAVVYTTNECRIRFNHLQQLEQAYHLLQLQKGQFQLEQASLASAGRIQQVAISKLHMQRPSAANTFLIQTR